MVSRLLYDRGPCLVAVVDSSHRIVRANPAFEQTFGNCEGRPCFEVYKGRDALCERCPTDEVFRTGAEQRFEEQGRAADGARLCYLVHAVPIRGDAAVGQVLHICDNVTRLRALEEELGQAERLARVGLTTAGLAHTIKNILAGLEGGVYVVGSALKKDDADRVRAGWGMVERYIEQVTALVRNLLSYARCDKPQWSEVDPSELVRAVVELYSSRAELVGIEIGAVVEPGIQPLWVDRGSIHACLANLVANALDACIWDPEPDKPHRIELRARTSKRGVVLEVYDNGMGISVEDQPKILAKIFTSKGIRGTGLGLLLTRKAVQEHGGTISFDTRPGRETTFRIVLPRRGEREPGQGPDRASAAK